MFIIKLDLIMVQKQGILTLIPPESPYCYTCEYDRQPAKFRLADCKYMIDLLPVTQYTIQETTGPAMHHVYVCMRFSAKGSGRYLPVQCTAVEAACVQGTSGNGHTFEKVVSAVAHETVVHCDIAYR